MSANTFPGIFRQVLSRPDGAAPGGQQHRQGESHQVFHCGRLLTPRAPRLQGKKVLGGSH